MEPSAASQTRGRPKPPTPPKPTGQQAQLAKHKSPADKKFTSKPPPPLPKQPPVGQTIPNDKVDSEFDEAKKCPPPLPTVPPVGHLDHDETKSSSCAGPVGGTDVHCPSSGITCPGAAGDVLLISDVTLDASADDVSGASSIVAPPTSVQPACPGPPQLKPKPKHTKPKPVPKKRLSLLKKPDEEGNESGTSASAMPVTTVTNVTGIADVGSSGTVISTGETSAIALPVENENGQDSHSQDSHNNINNHERWPKRDDVLKKLVSDLKDTDTEEDVLEVPISADTGIDLEVVTADTVSSKECIPPPAGPQVPEKAVLQRETLPPDISEKHHPCSSPSVIGQQSSPKSSPVPARPPRTKSKKMKKSVSLQSAGSLDSGSDYKPCQTPTDATGSGPITSSTPLEKSSKKSETANVTPTVRGMAFNLSDSISTGLQNQLTNKQRPHAPPKPAPKPSLSSKQIVKEETKHNSLNRSDSYQAALNDVLDDAMMCVAEASPNKADDDVYDDVLVPEHRQADNKPKSNIGIQVLPMPKPRKSADCSRGPMQTTRDKDEMSRQSPKRRRRSKTVEALCDSSTETSPEEKSDSEVKTLIKSKSLNALIDEDKGSKREKPVFVPPPPPPYSELGLDVNMEDIVQTASKMVQTPSGSLEDIPLEVETKSDKSSDLKNMAQKLDISLQATDSTSDGPSLKVVPTRKAPPPPMAKGKKNIKHNPPSKSVERSESSATRPLPARPAPGPPKNKSKPNKSGSTTRDSKVKSQYDEEGYLAPSSESQYCVEDSGEYAYVDVPVGKRDSESIAESPTSEKSRKKSRVSDSSSLASFGSHLYELIRSRAGSKSSNDGEKESKSCVFYCDVEDKQKLDDTDSSTLIDNHDVKNNLPPRSKKSASTRLSKVASADLESEIPAPMPRAPPRMKRKSKKPKETTDSEDDDYIYPENLNASDSDIVNNNISNVSPELPPELPPRQPSMTRSAILEKTIISHQALDEENEYTVPEDLISENDNCSPVQEAVPPALPPRKGSIHVPKVLVQTDSQDGDNEANDHDNGNNSDNEYTNPEEAEANDEEQPTPKLPPRLPREKTKNSPAKRKEEFDDESDEDGEYIYPEQAEDSEQPYSEVDDTFQRVYGSFSSASDSSRGTFASSPPDSGIKDSISDSECMYPGQSMPVKMRRNQLPKLHIPKNDPRRPSSWTGSPVNGDDEPYISMQKDTAGEIYMNQGALNSSASFMSDMSNRDSSSTLHTDPTDSDEEEELTEEELKARAEKKQRKIFCIAEEIMTSERGFVDQLKLLNIDFRRAVTRETAHLERPVVPTSVLNQVLKYLPQLQNFNEELLKDITNRITSWKEDPRVADIFVKKGPFLKLYTSYIREFENMCSALEDARKKYPEFDKVVKDFEASERCRNLALKHFMLKPIQRIPQYRLLLQDYLQHISEESADYKDTEIALVIVSEVAEHANQSMKYGDNFKKLWEIQSSLIGQFEVINPGRYLIKEGILKKLSRKEMQPRMFFLLNDILLYTTPVSGGYKLNNAIPLAGMKVSKPTKEDFQNEFSILSTQRSFTISASTPQERDEWLDVLKTSIEENVKRRYSFEVRKLQPLSITMDIDVDFKLGTRAPVWVPDARVSMCMLCTSEFTVAFRRHHCRACGKVVCRFCSDYRAPLRYLKYQAARVCADCYTVLSKEFENMKEEEVPVTPVSSDLKTSPFSKSSIKAKFRGFKMGSFGRGKFRRPAVLQEVHASSDDADMSGYLKVWKGKKWRKLWFVLKGKALYTYKASEDAAAVESKVLLGYEVKPFNSWFEGVEPSLVFELIHRGTPPIIFRTESPMSKEKWMKAMQDATIP